MHADSFGNLRRHEPDLRPIEHGLERHTNWNFALRGAETTISDERAHPACESQALARDYVLDWRIPGALGASRGCRGALFEVSDPGCVEDFVDLDEI